MVISLKLYSLFDVTFPPLQRRNHFGLMERDWDNPEVSIKLNSLNTTDTYCLIFNKDQNYAQKMYECLRATPGIKLVYQGQPAVNKTQGHGRAPRNFLVIFEYEPQVQPVPQVQVAG